MDSLVWIGKVIEISDIPNADFIQAATIVCGAGGKWRGVIKKGELVKDAMCRVYLPDTIVPQTDEFAFMSKNKFRVKMQRLRGCPSEVLILPYLAGLPVGTDITVGSGCFKYVKPMPAHLNGLAKGNFPSFIPKTDEPNYQSSQELVDLLQAHPYYVTEKCDGSSTTAYKYKGQFGVCSRNLELVENADNGYWKVANKYNLKETLPEGYAIQWETCGPGIQSNPMGLSEIDGFAFSVWDIEKRQYLEFKELKEFCSSLKFPMAKVIATGTSYNNIDLTELAKGFYENHKPSEGVVVRSAHHIHDRIISFKSINLDYKD
jgi:RNA ligase (TIGR02306 family)